MNASVEMNFNAEGWLTRGARKRGSPHHDQRPAQRAPELIVIHSISLPAGLYGGPYIEDLFQGTLDCSAHPSFQALAGLRVSAHFLIDRSGEVTQFVSVCDRAWHAGVSEFQGEPACNDFSIGIELEGCDTDRFTEAQLNCLKALCIHCQRFYPSLCWIAGHSDIAPGRKTDPGPYFPWKNFLSELSVEGISLTRPFDRRA